MFKKIFITYLSILILIMLVLSVIISSLADNYVYGEKEKVLEGVAFKANEAAQAYADGEIDNAQLTDEIDAMGYITNTKIYIIKANSSAHIELTSELADAYLRDALEKVLSGQKVYLREQYSQGFDAQMLFAGYPWKDDAGVKGAILLFSPEKEIASIVADIRFSIWFTALAFVLIGGCVVYLVSKKIVRPIKAIDAASIKMAKGEPVDDIVIHSKDEMGSLARSFNSMKEKLRKNEELRQDLIGNISHDLRTPITNINGFISGMADGVIKAEDYPKYIGILRQEARRLMNLTGEILETAKIQSGIIELHKSRLLLSAIVREAISANELLAHEKEVIIQVDMDEELSMDADPDKLGQVLYNLINNAVKYSHHKGTVIVTAKRLEKEIEICVKDSGTGIAADDLPYIFDRYYRAEKARGKTGYGLGLCIAKTYVEAHEGRIDVHSTEGEGSRICFTIPNS